MRKDSGKKALRKSEALSVSKKYNRQEQYVFTPPSDEGGAERLSEAEGEITKRYNNTPIIDSSRMIRFITHCIESGVFFV